MRRDIFWLILLPFLTLGLGIIGGEIFGIARAGTALAQLQARLSLIPAAPVVVDSLYDEQKGEVILTVANPGVMPITFATQSAILKPTTGDAVLAVVETPLRLVLLGGRTEVIRLQLTPIAKEQFKVGDVLAITLTYGYPVSNDVYSVLHLFQKSTQTTETGLVKSQLESNEAVQKRYEESLKKVSQ